MYSASPTWLALLAATAACGGQATGSAQSSSSGNDPPGNRDPTLFVGTWLCTGTVAGEANGAPTPTTPYSASETFTANTDGTLSQTEENGAVPYDAGAAECPPLRLTISGSTATLAGVQSCVSAHSEPGYAVTWYSTTETFVISGNTATFTSSGETVPMPGDSPSLLDVKSTSAGACTHSGANAPDAG